MPRILVLFLLFISFLGFAQQVSFQKTYGTAISDDCWDIAKSKAGDYITLGGQQGDIHIMKLDIYGDTAWTSSFGGIESESGYAVSQATGAGYVISGITYSYGAGGNGDAFVVKTDNSGTPEWSRTFGGIYGDDLTDVIIGNDENSYMFVGSTASFGSGATEWNIFLVKTNTDGDTLWTRSIGDSGSEYGHKIASTLDSGYVVTGYTNSFGAGLSDAYILKLDADGNVLWFNTFGGSEDDIGLNIIESNDGGYIVCGRTNSFGATDGDILVFKTDVNGNLVWTKKFGAFGTDLARDLYQTDAGDILVVGESYSMSMGESDVFLLQLDSAGNYSIGKSYGSSSFDYGRAIVPDDYQGYMIAGLTSSFGTGNLDLYLVNTNSLGESGCNEQPIFPAETEPNLQVQSQSVNVVAPPTEVSEPLPSYSSGTSINTLCLEVGIVEEFMATDVLIYPNPSREYLTIEFNQLSNASIEIQLFSAEGKSVLEGTLTEKLSTINIQKLSSGIYTYMLTADQIPLLHGKLVVQ